VAVVMVVMVHVCVVYGCKGTEDGCYVIQKRSTARKATEMVSGDNGIRGDFGCVNFPSKK
jgi:hypothetical protein